MVRTVLWRHNSLNRHQAECCVTVECSGAAHTLNSKM